MPSRAEPSAAAWLAGLSPWPREFRLDRMRALLAAFDEPQRSFRAVHIVGTNGKSTATRTIEELLAAEGLRVGAYLSPHVRSWSERIRVDGREADFERVVARIRPVAERLAATQFEAVTLAAFVEFRDAGVEAAAVEAGLGGRLDATNVLEAPVVLLTNVALEHTDVLGSTRVGIAREKLAVVARAATAVLPDREFAELVPHARIVIGGAREAAAAFLGRDVNTEVEVQLPGRLERRGDEPFELWDGAHNPDGLRWLLEHLPPRDYVVVASILGDKDVGAMLDLLARAGRRLVATRSSNPRALAAGELAGVAATNFESVDAVDEPGEALELARTLAGADGAVLVTGSLYLVGDVTENEEERTRCRTLVSG